MSLRSAKKNARSQRRPFQDLQNFSNSADILNEVQHTPVNPKKAPEKKAKKYSPPSVNSKQGIQIIIYSSENVFSQTWVLTQQV